VDYITVLFRIAKGPGLMIQFPDPRMLRHLDGPLGMLIDSAALHVYGRFVRIDDYLRSGVSKSFGEVRDK
jgi:hypothetical protein